MHYPGIVGVHPVRQASAVQPQHLRGSCVGVLQGNQPAAAEDKPLRGLAIAIKPAHVTFIVDGRRRGCRGPDIDRREFPGVDVVDISLAIAVAIDIKPCRHIEVIYGQELVHDRACQTRWRGTTG